MLQQGVAHTALDRDSSHVQGAPRVGRGRSERLVYSRSLSGAVQYLAGGGGVGGGRVRREGTGTVPRLMRWFGERGSGSPCGCAHGWRVAGEGGLKSRESGSSRV